MKTLVGLSPRHAARTTFVGVAPQAVAPAAPIAPAWTVMGFRNDRVTRSLGRGLPLNEAEKIADEWRDPAKRAAYRDEVCVIPIRWTTTRP